MKANEAPIAYRKYLIECNEDRKEGPYVSFLPEVPDAWAAAQKILDKIKNTMGSVQITGAKPPYKIGEWYIHDEFAYSSSTVTATDSTQHYININLDSPTTTGTIITNSNVNDWTYENILDDKNV
jgi:hypothetical protein